MIFFVDVALIKVEIISKNSFKIVIESLDNEFVVDEFFFEKRLRVVSIEEGSC